MLTGKGIWKCRQPDGSYNEVHHCYDFGTTLMNIGDLMPAKQKKEIVEFFKRELHDADLDAGALDPRSRCDIQHPARSSMDGRLLFVAGTGAERALYRRRNRTSRSIGSRGSQRQRSKARLPRRILPRFSVRPNRMAVRSKCPPTSPISMIGPVFRDVIISSRSWIRSLGSTRDFLTDHGETAFRQARSARPN